jgi:hypothetical protein
VSPNLSEKAGTRKQSKDELSIILTPEFLKMSNTLPLWSWRDSTTPAGLSEESVQQARKQFEEAGCLHLPALFPASQIERWRKEFLHRTRRFQTPKLQHKNALRVGDLRWMITVQLSGAFATTQLYANPVLEPLFRELLGAEYLLNSLGGVLSLPGAERQHDHRDLPALFGDDPIDGTLPCYAVTVLIPLIAANQEHGTTMVRPGSHRYPEASAEVMPEVHPVLEEGDVLLMDYRLHHGGTANLSNVSRPLLYLVFSRPWLRDFRNFFKQPPLLLSRREYNRLLPEHRGLFATAELCWW